MAVKVLVLTKLGKSSVLRKGHLFLICTKVPWASGGLVGMDLEEDKTGGRKTTTIIWAGKEDSLSSGNGDKLGEEGQSYVRLMRLGKEREKEREGEGMTPRSVCGWSCQSRG